MNAYLEKFTDLAFCFAIFSVAGWLLEAAYRSLRDKKITNPGLLKGPYLILYGSLAVILGEANEYLSNAAFLFKIPFYFILLTLLEFIASHFAEKIYRVKLWDYSDLKWQYKGKISLRYSLYWVLIALFYEKYLYPFFLNYSSKIPLNIKDSITIFILLLMISDYIYNFHLKNIFNISSEDEDIKNEFNALLQEFINDGEFKNLALFRHHKNKSRLNHVIEVAWFSFLIAKNLSCDTRSIVRGALLHDFFHYDWLREGPRLHGFRHPGLACRKASELFALSALEKDIIKKHMWPLTPVPPFYLESWIVCMVDTVCSVMDYLHISLPELSAVKSISNQNR